ncbi:MAG TPA: hypothetical protein PK263_02285 [bacterium]|nr:hypothetical protein [bacterium]
MSKESRAFLVVVIVVVILAGGLIFVFSKNKKTGNTNDDRVAGVTSEDETVPASSYSNEYIEKLAKFLSEKGAVLYGAYWCPHCQEQKELFGQAFKYIDYVECDAKGTNSNPDECEAVDIKSYPT